MLEIRQLQYFIAVAEDRSFTTAAVRLHVSQPALSQQVKALERALGSILIDRGTQPVSLTHAGGRLLEYAYRVIRAADDAEEAVRALSSAHVGVLRVGTVIGGFYDILEPAIRQLRIRYPDARFPVHQHGSADQLAALRRGDVDVMLHRRVDTEPFGDLVSEPLRADRLIALVPNGHPAYRDGAVELADLAGERFASFRRIWMPRVYDLCLAACHTAGFVPDIREYCDNPMTLALAVVGGAVALSGDGMSGRYPGVHYALTTPATYIADISAVWRPDSDNPLLPLFVSRVVEHCRATSGGIVSDPDSA